MDDAELTERIRRAQASEVQGDMNAARALYAELWEEAARRGDMYAACIASHFMAHAQNEPETQLAWHTRAFDSAEAARVAGDERVAPFLPSLQANLADVYMRLGDRGQAKAYIEEARAGESALRDDAYGQSVRTLITRLNEALENDDNANQR